MSTDKTRKGICAVPSFVPRCPSERTAHLLDAKTSMLAYPMLTFSKSCFDVVGCNPKRSCLGENVCAHGYDHVYSRCLKAVQEKGLAGNCSTDDDCTGHSGVGSEKRRSEWEACPITKAESCS